ncbi:MAG: heavy-metal-associated domain-containing protein, partial [Peptococcaceae bacterium]|nr:heavy-metal-associated domain-containing protein [Peptococcaceae bacterium]
MLQKYKLDGLACAHCAATIEREINSWSDVKDANLDLMTGKLVVDTDSDATEMFDRVRDCVAKVESKVKVSSLTGAAASTAAPAAHHHDGDSCGCGHDHEHEHHHDGDSCGCGHDHE